MKRERDIYTEKVFIVVKLYCAELHVFLYFMNFMFHAFTLLLALDHIEASVFIPLGVHPSFFQHHRLVLVEKNMNTQYCISFLSRPTARHIGHTLKVT